jgi:2-(1,2-epoxy-1,2-dihydrophenyl)acetyl-CoA isomerase
MFEAHENGDYLVQLENGVLRVSLNRPKFGNAIGQTTVPGLVQLFRDAQESVQVRSILIRGEGKIFSAGGDVAGFVRALQQDVPSRQADFSRRLSNLRVLVETVLAFDRPIVVSVRGAAAGAGLFYPLAADYVIGDPTALFIFAHQGVALCPDNGISALLPQVVGQRMARSLVLTAARVKADEALRLGIMHRIVQPEELEAEASAAALRLARAPRRAVIVAKKLMNESSDRSIGEQLDAEMNGIVACVGDDDFEEGVRAFLDKRTPNFPSAQ